MLIEGKEKGKEDAHGKKDAQHLAPMRPLGLVALVRNPPVDIEEQIGKTDSIGRGQKHLRHCAGQDCGGIRSQTKMKKHVCQPAEYKRNRIAQG